MVKPIVTKSGASRMPAAVFTGLTWVSALMLGLVSAPSDAEDLCNLHDCQEFREWSQGQTYLASGRRVFVAETPAYYSDQIEHRLTFVFTPGRCDLPKVYFRFPTRQEAAFFPRRFSGRFQVNAADWYQFQGRLFLPEGRPGTGWFDSLQPSPKVFLEAVKAGETLNALIPDVAGRLRLYEYRLEGSRAALVEAQRQCSQAPPEPENWMARMEEDSGSEQPVPSDDWSDAISEGGPAYAICRDLGFLRDSHLGAEYARFDGILRNELGFGADALGVPYEMICMDFVDGFGAEALAGALIEKYRSRKAAP